jgi:hypothetical protein
MMIAGRYWGIAYMGFILAFRSRGFINEHLHMGRERDVNHG